MTFFEIDPVVIAVAEDARLFSYLADAPTPPRIVEGDARLSLAAEPDAASTSSSSTRSRATRSRST